MAELARYRIVIEEEACQHGKHHPHSGRWPLSSQWSEDDCPGPRRLDLGTFQASPKMLEQWREARG